MNDNSGLRTRLLTGILAIVGCLALMSIVAHLMTERLIAAEIFEATTAQDRQRLFKLLTFQTWAQFAILGGLIALLVYFVILPMVRRVEASQQEVEELDGALGRKEEEIAELTRRDRTTGLPELHYFEELLNHSLTVGERHGHAVALLRIGLTGYRRTALSLGSEATDAFLRDLAARLSDTLRASDYVARIGEDEFAIVVPELKTVEGIGTLADRVLNELADARRSIEDECALTGAVGIAVAWAGDHVNGNTLMGRAREALEQAGAEEDDAWRYHPSAIQGMSDRLTIAG